MKLIKRTFCSFMVVLVLIGSIPLNVFADDQDGYEFTDNGEDTNDDNLGRGEREYWTNLKGFKDEDMKAQVQEGGGPPYSKYAYTSDLPTMFAYYGNSVKIAGTDYSTSVKRQKSISSFDECRTFWLKIEQAVGGLPSTFPKVLYNQESSDSDTWMCIIDPASGMLQRYLGDGEWDDNIMSELHPKCYEELWTAYNSVVTADDKWDTPNSTSDLAKICYDYFELPGNEKNWFIIYASCFTMENTLQSGYNSALPRSPFGEIALYNVGDNLEDPYVYIRAGTMKAGGIDDDGTLLFDEYGAANSSWNNGTGVDFYYAIQCNFIPVATQYLQYDIINNQGDDINWYDDYIYKGITNEDTDAIDAQYAWTETNLLGQADPSCHREDGNLNYAYSGIGKEVLAYSFSNPDKGNLMDATFKLAWRPSSSFINHCTDEDNYADVDQSELNEDNSNGLYLYLKAYIPQPMILQHYDWRVVGKCCYEIGDSSFARSMQFAITSEFDLYKSMGSSDYRNNTGLSAAALGPYPRFSKTKGYLGTNTFSIKVKDGEDFFTILSAANVTASGGRGTIDELLSLYEDGQQLLFEGVDMVPKYWIAYGKTNENEHSESSLDVHNAYNLGLIEKSFQAQMIGYAVADVDPTTETAIGQYKSKVIHGCYMYWRDYFQKLYLDYAEYLRDAIEENMQEYLDSKTHLDVESELWNAINYTYTIDVNRQLSEYSAEDKVEDMQSMLDTLQEEGITLNVPDVTNVKYKLAYGTAGSSDEEYIIINGSTQGKPTIPLPGKDMEYTKAHVFSIQDFFDKHEHEIGDGSESDIGWMAFRLVASLNINTTYLNKYAGNQVVPPDMKWLESKYQGIVMEFSSSEIDGLDDDYFDWLDTSHVPTLVTEDSFDDALAPAFSMGVTIPYVSFRLIYGDLANGESSMSTLYNYYNASIEELLNYEATEKGYSFEQFSAMSCFTIAPFPDIPLVQKNWKAIAQNNNTMAIGRFNFNSPADVSRWSQYAYSVYYGYFGLWAAELRVLNQYNNNPEEVKKALDELCDSIKNEGYEAVFDANSDARKGKTDLWRLLECVCALHDLEVTCGIPESEWDTFWTTGYDKVGYGCDMSIVEYGNYLFKELEASGVREEIDSTRKSMQGMAEASSVDKSSIIGEFWNGKTPTTIWATGFAMSSCYEPGFTNLNTADGFILNVSKDTVPDLSNYQENYIRYGYFRKALYRSTGGNAFIKYVTDGKTPGVTVCTLRDLFTKNDLMLFIDDNFYNADYVAEKMDWNYNDAKTYMEDKVLATTDGIKSSGSTGLDNVGDIINDTADNASDGDWSGVTDSLGDIGDIPSNMAKVYKDKSYDETNHTLKNGPFTSYDGKSIIMRGEGNSWMALTGSFSLRDESKDFEDPSETSAHRAFAFVYGIYDNTDNFNEANTYGSNPKPVFCSSKSIANSKLKTSSRKYYLAYINYLYLRSIEDQFMTSGKLISELDSPVFIDCYGNIMTYSGYVIIPAATNTTLTGDHWSPYTRGTMNYYDEFVDSEYNSIKYMSEDCFKYLTGYEYSMDDVGNVSISANTVSDKPSTDETKQTTGCWFAYDVGADRLYLPNNELQFLKNSNIDSIRNDRFYNDKININWNNKTVVNEQLLMAFFYNSRYSVAPNADDDTIKTLLYEVFRGAYISEIDLNKEMLDGTREISTLGVTMASKMEELTDLLNPYADGSFTRSNTTVSIPKITYIKGFEFLALVMIKFFLALLILGLCISIYKAAVVNRIAWKEAGNAVVTIALLGSAVLLLPKFVTWSYEDSVKDLLQKEADMSVLYEYNKLYTTTEIGVTEIRDVRHDGEYYIKVGDLSINWPSFLTSMIFEQDTKSVQDAYENQFIDDPLYGQRNVEQKGESIYMDIMNVLEDSQFICKSVGVEDMNGNIVNASYIGLTSKDGVNPVVSYSLPYYPMLEQLLFNINAHNSLMGVITTRYELADNGRYATYDLAADYLTSDYVKNEEYDIFGLYTLYDIQTEKISPYGYVYWGDQSNWRERFQATAWYSRLPEQATQANIDKLNDYARDWLIKYEDLMTKVPDEVFVKCFVLSCAIEWNRLCVNGTADSIVIDNISTETLFRLMSGTPRQVFESYTKSWSRSVYDSYGGFGIILSTIAYAILWIASWIKPIILVLLFFLVILNILTRNIVFWKQSNAIKGYLISIAALTVMNFVYALMLKLCFLVAYFGAGLIVNYLLLILVQVGYLLLSFKFIVWLVKDWKDIGLLEFQALAADLSARFANIKSVVFNRAEFKGSVSHRGSTSSDAKYRNEGPSIGSEMVEHMHQKDIERDSHSRDKT